LLHELALGLSVRQEKPKGNRPGMRPSSPIRPTEVNVKQSEIPEIDRIGDAAGRYPPVEDYAYISDMHCTALVSRTGSVDWCCMPRMDSDSCFARLLDWDRGGYCMIVPVGEYTATRRYLPDTMILETHFVTPHGEARLTDFFVMDPDEPENAHYDLIRIVDGIAGVVDFTWDLQARFGYGEILPYMQREASGAYTARGSNQALIVHADLPLDVVQHRDLYGEGRVKAGDRLRMAIQFEYPEMVERTLGRGLPTAAEIDHYLDCTRDWWVDWASRMRHKSALDAQTVRSTLVLKALTFERTGAIIAAPTTSLPEWIGMGRNWDYRFSWIRDSVFTIRALYELGYEYEADRFHRFVLRTSAGHAGQLQIMYGIDGKRRLTEVELDWLEGYRQSRPVRIGNGAAKQNQLDIFGDLLRMAWEWHAHGYQTEPEYWDFLIDVVNRVCEHWSEPDHGIWEIRDEPRHHVYSKAMCWAALDCGIRLAETASISAPVERWITSRDAIRKLIETQGYSASRRTFVQDFEGEQLDASLLLLPAVGFIDYMDPRMLRTATAIRENLEKDGLLLRYRSPDGLRGPEGVFLPCTFWLVNCLAHQGQAEAAWEYYERALGCANDLGLFSEEYDPQARRMLGNFPQGLTHVSQIMARVALARNCERRCVRSVRV
jgi:GH15 family glucan-1,4-alpha-glucosidase